MLLTCPSCGARHIDKGEFATKAHHTHACQRCGMCWRPAIVATTGVRFLPGYKDGNRMTDAHAETAVRAIYERWHREGGDRTFMGICHDACVGKP